MAIDPDVKKGIKISLIASLIFLMLIQPLIRVLGKFTSWVLPQIYSGFTNSIYKSAAMGMREKNSFIMLAMFTFLVTISLVMVSIKIIITTSNRNHQARIKNSESKLLTYFTSTTTMIILCIILCVNASIAIGKEFVELQLISTFHQRIYAITPYTSDQSIKLLRSKWALMKSREDYLIISSEIETIAKNNNLVLPPSLWE